MIMYCDVLGENVFYYIDVLFNMCYDFDGCTIFPSQFDCKCLQNVS